MIRPTGAPAGHDERGRFVNGNPGGPGNPHRRKVAGLREALLRNVTEQDIEDIVQALIDVAKEGSLPAIKLFLAYVVGKPSALDLSDPSLWPTEDEMPWLNEARAKVDAAMAASGVGRQTSPATAPIERPPDVTAAPSQVGGPIEKPSASVDAAVVQADCPSVLNGGKRLTKKERRALRRQAKQQPSASGGNGRSSPKLNGDNGWLVEPAPAGDPLAALARQRDLLK